MKSFRQFIVLAVLLACPLAWGAPVLLISIDGLRPDYLTHADEHGLKIPNLRRLIKEGVYAEGVTGVAPTVTYPSHTTLVTGVSPAKHGILANTTFDPTNENMAGWYWYASAIKVPTLWQAANDAGMVTASLNWPVTVGAKGIRYLVPEYWRAHTPEDRKLLEALSRPDGLLDELESKLGLYTNGNETTIEGDEVRTRFTIEILKTRKPAFMTLHLTALDEMQHETTPFSAASNQTLEMLDGMIARLIATAVGNDPEAVVAVVSDHGFARTDVRVNLMIPFVEEKLVGTKNWDAAPWPAGAGVAIILRNPGDQAVKIRVKAMLDRIAVKPEYGIARILESTEIQKMGAFPDAAYFVELKPGYSLGTALSGPVVSPAPGTGAHGYLPDRPEMRASFFLLGHSVANGKNVGLIDMRQIAPTLAAILGVKLPLADLPAIDVKPSSR
ncbi:MAG: ectonucleotide pyrophosphatase/phosphodiesterase [Acidobacteriia bacterium]|nr:ectonucleotide pyrophosphatase/phosphodiesterase [Terriglobia bacterium]